LFEN
jgi:hypothetical protein